MKQPITSCSHGFNWTLGNPLGEMSRIINHRLDYERDMRYWSDDWDDNEQYFEDDNIEEEYDPLEFEIENELPSEPDSPMTPKQRGIASKRKKVKLTKNGGTNFDWD